MFKTGFGKTNLTILLLNIINKNLYAKLAKLKLIKNYDSFFQIKEFITIIYQRLFNKPTPENTNTLSKILNLENILLLSLTIFTFS